MQRRLLASAFLFVLLVIVATPAFAGYSWCVTDPNIQLKRGDGVLHVLVEVPEQYADTPLTIDVTVPPGSRVVGNTHNVTVVLHEGADNQITVTEAAGFPVRLSVRLKGKYLQPGVVTLWDGSGEATWTW